MFGVDRLLLSAAVLAAALPLLVPLDALPRVLATAVTVAAIAFVLLDGQAPHPAATALKSMDKRCGEIDVEKRSKGGVDMDVDKRGGTLRPFAAVDTELYTLRSLSPAELVLQRHPRRLLPHLAFRGPLLSLVRRAARLAARNGNSASGARAMVALEDFFARYHHALLSPDVELAVRSLQTMRDTRATALNALQDLSLTVPIALGGPMRQAAEAARNETQRCMAALADRHAPSLSPSLSAAASAWSAPQAHDPQHSRPNSLF